MRFFSRRITGFEAGRGRPRVTICDLPQIAIPGDPAFLSDCSSLWLAYESFRPHGNNTCTVVRFEDLIHFHKWPFGDESLGQHPLASTGLTFFGFHAISNSVETARWKALDARHWVAAFKDVTIDVVARNATVLPDAGNVAPIDAIVAHVAQSRLERVHETRSVSCMVCFDFHSEPAATENPVLV